MLEMDGTIFFCNAAAESICGLSASQMRGTTPTDPLWRCYRPDGSDFPGEEHPSSVSIRSGLPQRGVEAAVRKPSGEMTWITIDTHFASLQGQRVVVVSFVDISAAKRTQDLYRATFEEAPMGVLHVDDTGRITSVNR